MKIFLIQNETIIKNLICLAFAFDFFIFTTCYFYNKKAYRKIVEIYEKEIGPLPLSTKLCKDASVFLTPCLYNEKVNFITRSLNFKYHKHLHHGISIEGYNLIRNLPKKLTLGFRIESMSLFICIPIIIGFFIIF